MHTRLMKMRNITKNEKMEVPPIDTIEKIRESEKVFDEWFTGKHGYSPSSRVKYLHYECIRPWFTNLYEQNTSNRNQFINWYGEYLQAILVDTIQEEINMREYLKNTESILGKIRFYSNIFLTSWSQSKSDGIILRFARITGPEAEQKARHAMSRKTKFNDQGMLLTPD